MAPCDRAGNEMAADTGDAKTEHYYPGPCSRHPAAMSASGTSCQHGPRSVSTTDDDLLSKAHALICSSEPRSIIVSSCLPLILDVPWPRLLPTSPSSAQPSRPRSSRDASRSLPGVIGPLPLHPHPLHVTTHQPMQTITTITPLYPVLRTGMNVQV
eukprot:758404-Hanusia_phi.AAC.4